MENIVLKSLIEKREKLFVQLEILDSMIAEEERISGTNNDEGQYSESKIPSPRKMTRTKFSKRTLGKTDNEKFLGVLKNKQRFMKIREIAQEVYNLEGGSIEGWVQKFSRKTKHLKELNKIVKFQVGSLNTNVFWGSPNWINEDGKIKKKYEYNQDAIFTKGSQSLEGYEL